MLQIALPNKGALATDSVELIKTAGYRCKRSGRELRVKDAENETLFYFLRPRDIVTYVSNGVLDLGITGRDFMIEQQANLKEILSLGFGAARLCYAGPHHQYRSVEDFEGLRIATSFSHLVSVDLAAKNVRAEIVPLDGAVEVSIQLGVADVIADLVQTGRTLEEARLSVIGEPLLETEALLVGRAGILETETAANLFVRRLQGILLARTYVMVEYDCPRTSLEKACEVTPGIESPTIAPLSNPDWVAIKAMAHRKDTNRIMDDLEDLGAKGIIVTDIRTCRI
ncbi:MAG: ATP phosphoribosyltransferase [Rhodothermaceae bacterium]|nr:ATP phosphoribosyltransferase [Rhodothermaceae bacterium]MXX58410.1 ATP phosphoribosyltransferase [Rhodothermaceae bacterium]MYD20113.1 ATP phosphoribosyltransferase [Rhodothermaceae bacterium]MYD56427.1 ATP phosphoribosyltransferase [Rhodothermaceae bacterium]MYI44149.1 ATP phosphoribosyltransferase [Rhodothermaceae bacterium]